MQEPKQARRWGLVPRSCEDARLPEEIEFSAIRQTVNFQRKVFCLFLLTESTPTELGAEEGA